MYAATRKKAIIWREKLKHCRFEISPLLRSSHTQSTTPVISELSLLIIFHSISFAASTETDQISEIFSDQ